MFRVSRILAVFRAVARLLICGILSAIWSYGEPPETTPESSPAQPAPETAETQAAEPVPARSIVYRAENLHAIKDYDANPEVVRRMVDQLVLAVSGQTTVGAAWASLVQGTGVVGVKVC